jgi:uncharacterized protein (TIGR03792 family)
MKRRPSLRLPSLLLSLCLLLLVLAGGPADAFALGKESPAPREGGPERTVVEQLRLKVASEARSAWLQAERETWEPWLQQQDGFEGRDLLWDAEREEGLLLIRWRSRGQWLAIPESEIAAVQQRFEAAARTALSGDPAAALDARGENPFPLVFAGELELMGVTAPSPAALAP